MLHPGKKKEVYGPQACSAQHVLSVQKEALGELFQSLRRTLHLWVAQNNLSRLLSPCSNFSLLGQGFHPITIPLQPWAGAGVSLGIQHSTQLTCTACAGDILTPLQTPGWPQILTDISHVNCCWPYLQDQDHIFLLIPGRTSFNRPGIGNSSFCFPCFPAGFHVGSCLSQ